jgi:hypothetical protein
MSNFVLTRALTTGATVAALTAGILAISVTAYAHGSGGPGGGGPKGMTTGTTGKMMTTNSMNHTSHWRRFDFVGPSYVDPSYGCVYKHTARGTARVCGQVY